MGKSLYKWIVVRSGDGTEVVKAVDLDDLYYQLETPEDVIMVVRQESV
jgi:hypothetical protein